MSKSKPSGAAAPFFNPFPKYLQVRHILARRLSLEYQPGDRLPTEQVLCEEFGVSRETVREALRGLEQEGVIERHRAKGTFLTRRPDAPSSKRLTGLVEDFSSLHLDTYARVLNFGPVPPGLEPGLDQIATQEVYKIARLRYFEGQPLALHHAFMVAEVGSKVAAENMENAPISEILEMRLGLRCTEERQTIEAMVADTELAQLLAIPVGAPVLLISRLCRLSSVESSVLFKSYFRADRYYYTISLAGDRQGRRPYL